MDIEAIKTQLQTKKVSFGAWNMIGHPAVAEILAQARFDWVVIDMEHGLVPWSGLLGHIMAIQTHDKSALVRLPAQRKEFFQRVLDCGADGVIVPNIRTPEEAAAAKQAAKYAPQGSRGVGISRAHAYGQSFNTYIHTANRKTLLVFQIEHIQAVDVLDDILNTPGLDAILIGPYDLSGTMGRAGETHHPQVQKVIDKIVKKAIQHKVAPGIHLVDPDEAKIRNALYQGMQFIALGLDTYMLAHAAENLQKISEKFHQTSV